jgi:hypothetical protein
MRLPTAHYFSIDVVRRSGPKNAADTNARFCKRQARPALPFSDCCKDPLPPIQMKIAGPEFAARDGSSDLPRRAHGTMAVSETGLAPT